MSYPSLDRVEKASLYELCSWQRFLPSPGMSAIGAPAEFEAKLQQEAEVMRRIVERVKALGGFTPAISKSLGFER